MDSNFDWEALKKKIAAATPNPGDYANDDDADSVSTSQAAPDVPFIGSLKTRIPASDDDSDKPDVSQFVGPLPQQDEVADQQDDDDDAQVQKPVNPVLAAYLQNKMQMQQAQEQASRNQTATGLSAALAQIAHGISRAPGQADLGAINESAKSDNAPITNLVAQQKAGTDAMQQARAQEENDPDSPTSVATRKVYAPILTKAGMDPETLEGMSAQDVKDYLQNPIEFKQKQDQIQASKQATLEAQQARLQQQSEDRANKQDSRQQQQDQKTAVDLQTKLDSSGARAGNFGKAGAMSMAADRINAILRQYPDGNIPKAQTEELASASAALVGGGSIQSQNQLNAIVPQSLWGNAQALAAWLTNEPRGLQQQEFIKNIADSANREKEVADKQMDDIKVQRLAAYNDYAQRNPESFSRIIKSAGLDPTNYDFKTGEYKRSQSGSQSGQNSSGTVQIRDPQGNIRSVPVSKKDAAIAAGGTLVQ